MAFLVKPLAKPFARTKSLSGSQDGRQFEMTSVVAKFELHPLENGPRRAEEESSPGTLTSTSRPAPLSLDSYWNSHQYLPLDLYTSATASSNPSPSRPLPYPLPPGALPPTPPSAGSSFRHQPAGADERQDSSRSGSRRWRSLSLRPKQTQGKKLVKRQSGIPMSPVETRRLPPLTFMDESLIPDSPECTRQDSMSSASHTAESSTIIITPPEPLMSNLAGPLYVAAGQSEISLRQFMHEEPLKAISEVEASRAVLPCNAVRPPLHRLRSSSLGTLADSLRDLGDVLVAERATVSEARLASATSLVNTNAGGTGKDAEPGDRRMRAPPPPPHLASSVTVGRQEVVSPGRDPRGFRRLLRAMSYGGTKREKEATEGEPERPSLPWRLSKPKQTRRKSTFMELSHTEMEVATSEAISQLSPLGTIVPPVPPLASRPNFIRSRSVSLDSNFKALGVPDARQFHSASEGGCFETPTNEVPRPSSPTVILKALEETEVQSRAELHNGGLRRKESLALLENDARRRCRQTLVDIQDDGVFHEVLQTLKRTEGRRRMSNVSQIPRPVSVATEVAWEKSVRAWFVTRELVKSEKSYGRYLARGIQMLRMDLAAAELRTPSVRLPRKSLSGPSTSSSPRKSKGKPRRASTHPDRTAFTEFDSESSWLAPGGNSLSTAESHLPRLLSLSTELSTLFAHNPSPHGVATSFLVFEDKLTLEYAEWARQVGELIGSSQLYTAGLHHDRLSLSDIVSYCPCSVCKLT